MAGAGVPLLGSQLGGGRLDGARKGRELMPTLYLRWREMLMVSDVCGAHLPVIFQPVAAACRWT
jgi:hypothetical protein